MLDQVFAVLVVHLLRRSIYVPGRSGVSTKEWLTGIRLPRLLHS
ncbi:hypothetical protein LEMLEM_LOCUS6611 [Lemmus lemmus]